jgi:hypothetical protein
LICIHLIFLEKDGRRTMEAHAKAVVTGIGTVVAIAAAGTLIGKGTLLAVNYVAPRDEMRRKVQEAYERACKEDGKQYAPPGHIPIYTLDQLHYMLTGRVRVFEATGLGLTWLTDQEDGTTRIYSGIVRQDGKVSRLSLGLSVPSAEIPRAAVEDGFLKGRTWHPEYDYPCQSPHMAILEYK